MVVTIDCDYVMSEFAAAYLVVDGDEAAFVETNTEKSVPKLLATLKANGLQAEQVRYIIITHVHLDHAGGASALMEACPNAQLVAHPRAAPHMIDPAKIIAGAKAVYGEQTYNQLYGRIVPIPAERVLEMQDGQELKMGARTFRFLHTRGHANHHFCVYDSGSDAVFTGDSFGLAYPALQRGGLFVFPSTSPTQFDPEEARKSVGKILQTGASRAYLTHFGELTDLRGAAEQLKTHLDFSQELLESTRAKAASGTSSEAELTTDLKGQLIAHYEPELKKRGFGPEAIVEALKVIDFDLELNAAGIAYVACRRD